MAVDIYSNLPGDDINSEELKLYNLINQYRNENNLPPIPFSKALSIVANRHVWDLAENIGYLTHGWSDEPYEATNSSTYPSMWNAPQRFNTGYSGYGFENAFGGTNGYIATAEDALSGWKNSTAHNDVILNKNVWQNFPWNALGVGIYKGYAVIWFGQEFDPTGQPIIDGNDTSGNNNPSQSQPIDDPIIDPTHRSVPDYIGNNPEDALVFDVTHASFSFVDSIGLTTDFNDYYTFALNETKDVAIGLTDLLADADLQLLDSNGNIIVGSQSNGNSNESITESLTAGKYYISITPLIGETNYSLTVSATNASNSSLSNITDSQLEPIYRFQSQVIPGTYLFAGKGERDSINRNFGSTFKEEGFAFYVGVTEDDDLIPMYRFQNRDVQGTYLYAGEAESANIRANFPNFIEEGVAFYVLRGSGSQGEAVYRFQNSNLPGTYLFVMEAERQNILNNFPNFTEEGIAFRAS